MVLGHESAGIIEKVGAKTRGLKIGDRVAMEPGAACRICDSCKGGQYHLCPDMAFAATPPYDGTLARFYRIPADLAYPLPDNLSFEDGAMIEPLAVGIHSVAKLGGFRPNQSILVFGCGPVGLLCMAVAKAHGASRIIAVDIKPSRLELAQSYVATHKFSPPQPEVDEIGITYSKRCAAEMKRTLGIEDRGPQSIDLVIDASGAATSIQTAIYVVKTGGTFVQVGLGNPDIAVDVGQIICRELTIKGSFRYGPGDYQLAIALVAQSKINLKPLVTHRYTFGDAGLAFAATKSGVGPDGKGVIKVMISGPDAPIADPKE